MGSSFTISFHFGILRDFGSTCFWNDDGLVLASETALWENIIIFELSISSKNFHRVVPEFTRFSMV
jgi:hypothetical protein